MKSIQSVSLIAAAITTGLTAGVLAAFAIAVMPGLRGTDDRAFVDVMQRVNDAIYNGFFLTAFMGGLVFSGVAAVLFWRGDERQALPWIVAGLGLYLVMFVITMAINVPLNDKLVAAGDPSRISNLASVRNDFEGPWVVWNAIRTVANTAALGCLLYALVLHGRTTGGEDRPVKTTQEISVTAPAWAPPAG